MQRKHLNISRQHSSTRAYISKNKSSNKNKEPQQIDISDYKEEPSQQSDIKEEIVDKIDQHQKVLNVTFGDTKVINLVTAESAQIECSR